MAETRDRLGDSSEEPKFPATGSVVTLRRGVEKRWVIVSRFEAQEKSKAINSKVIIGLCDGNNFKYYEEKKFLQTAKPAPGGNQELIENAMTHKHVRTVAFQEFDKLHSDGIIPSYITANDREVRREIDRVFGYCSPPLAESGQTSEAMAEYAGHVRTMLIEKFGTAEVSESENMSEMKAKPLLDGKTINFMDALSVHTVEIDGKQKQLVTINFVLRLLDGKSRDNLSIKQAADWLKQNGISAIPYRAECTIFGRTSLCNAYDYQEVLGGYASAQKNSEEEDRSQLPEVNKEGYVLTDNPVSGQVERHWIAAQYCKGDELPDSRHLIAALQRAMPETKSVLAYKDNRTKKPCRVWPESALEKARSLVLNKKGVTQISGKDDSDLIVSATEKYLPAGKSRRAVLVHQLNNAVQALTILDLEKECDVKPDTVTRIAQRRMISVRKISPPNRKEYYIYTKDNPSDDNNSVIMVQTSQKFSDLEPARKLDELSVALEKLKEEDID